MLKDLVHKDDIVPTLVPLLAHFKVEHRPGEMFGDYCQRLGADALVALLPNQSSQSAEARASSKEPSTAAAQARPESPLSPSGCNGAHGNAHKGHQTDHQERAALANPETRSVPLALADPVITPKPVENPAGRRRSERFYAGGAGEELLDYSFRYTGDGEVSETVIYFYGEDLRATASHRGLPVRRRAVYRGKADPARLYAAEKCSDTFFVGAAGHERRDYRVDYQSDGSVKQTVVYYYASEARAGDVTSGIAVRRQAVYEGKLE